jgi:cytochrome c peroxidase
VTSNPNNPTNLKGKFQFHPGQGFIFGAQELAGLKIFLAEPSAVPPTAPELAAGQIGNCIACHAAQNFTDFKLHNTGIAQAEYDVIHGNGSFAALAIPSLGVRTSNDLPATDPHQSAKEFFRSVPVLTDPALTDLGVWNIFLNPDMPNPQAKIRAILCDEHLPAACPADNVLLDEAIARFKPPGLRDLGHSAPYMHNGQFGTLDDAVGFYLGTSNRARAGILRNGINAVRGIALLPADIAPLVAFLKSLNEDYQIGGNPRMIKRPASP